MRAEFLVDAQGLNKVDGLPFRRIDIQLAIMSQLDMLVVFTVTAPTLAPRRNR